MSSKFHQSLRILKGEELRIKIQYTTTVENLPDELKSLKLKVISKLKREIEALDKLSVESLELESLDAVDLVRRGLFDVDTLLGDFDAIIKDYCRLRTAQPQPKGGDGE